MPDTKSKLLTSSAWNWALFITNAVITFWMSPFLVRNLGDDRYGLWSITVSLIGYCGLLDIGFRNALVRFVARYHAERDLNSLNQVVNIGFAVFSVASVFTALVSATFAIWAAKFFHLPLDLIHEARLTIIIVGMAFSLQFPLNALSGILVGLQRFDISAKITFAMVMLQSFGYFVALTGGGGLISIAMINTMFGTFAVGVMAYIGKNLVPGLKIIPSFSPKHLLVDMVRYSSCVFVIGLASRIMNYTIPFILGLMMDLKSVAIYSIPTMLLMYSVNCVNNFCRVLQPFASSKNATGSDDELIETTLWSTRLALIIYYPIFIFIFVLGPTFIGKWLNPVYGSSVTLVLPFLSIATIFVIADMPIENIMMGTGRVRVLSVVLMVEALFCILLAIMLIPHFQLNGVAFAMSAPIIISRGMIFPLYASKRIGFDFQCYYLGTILPLTILMLPLLVATMLIERFFETETYLGLIMSALGILLVWVLLVSFCTKDGRMMLARFGLILKPKRAI